jgi:hypothetical protein
MLSAYTKFHWNHALAAVIEQLSRIDPLIGGFMGVALRLPGTASRPLRHVLADLLDELH